MFGLLSWGFEIGTGGLQGPQTVNVSTPTVAVAAGIAAMLALETRASAAVGVAISVTTIPASAYLGVAAAVGEGEKAAGALLVLAINVAMLVAGRAPRCSSSGRSPPPARGGARTGHGQARRIGFAAHPFSTGGHMLVPSVARRIVLPHGWPVLDEPDGTDGLELWSLTTDAAEGWRTPAEAWRWLRDPEAAVARGAPPEHLRRWDALSAHRRVPAIAGLDGHAPGVRLRGRVRSPLSHARTFDLLRTHLVAERALTGDVGLDRATLIRALGAGSAWLTCPFVARAEGARLWAEGGDGTTIPMGGAGRAQPGILRLRLPRAADIRVLRDGSPCHAAHGARLDLDVVSPGVYRVEARIGGRLWMLSNPIHLR